MRSEHTSMSRGLLVAAWAASSVAAAGAGWMARGQATAPPAAAAAAARPSGDAPAQAAAAPLIAVSGDGQVTLRVEQQPLDWVLEQIALQSGRDDVRALRLPARAASAPAVPLPAADAGDGEPPDALHCPTHPPLDPARLLFAIEHGADDARADAVLRARADALPVPEPLLRTLLETAPSERVRLAALESLLERHEADTRAARALLETALHLPSPLVQQEARQRLDDLDEIERLDAQAAQGATSP